MYFLKIFTFQHLFFLIFSEQNANPSPRTGPPDLLVTHYDCEENEQKTLHKYAINQVTQCESEPQAIEITNIIATFYSKARATTLTGYKFTATFSEKKYIVHKSQLEKCTWKHLRLSEPLEPVVRHAPLSEPQYEKTYNIYPTLQQDLNRVRHISQNQTTHEINRQIIHPRQNRKFQTRRVFFSIPQPPTPTTSELSSTTVPTFPTLASQQSISNLPSDYLGSTPTSEEFRENPFNPPESIERLPYWTTH